MIIVDFDSVRNNQKACEFVCKKIQECILPIPNIPLTEESKYAPMRAIYWFSKKTITKKDLEKRSLPTIGANFAKAPKLVEYLRWMKDDIHKYSMKHGMGAFYGFKKTTVITDTDLIEIQKMGADVVLVSMFGGNS